MKPREQGVEMWAAYFEAALELMDLRYCEHAGVWVAEYVRAPLSCYCVAKYPHAARMGCAEKMLRVGVRL